MSSEKGKNLFMGVNEPADPGNLTDLEKKHLPVIQAPDKIKPGECFEMTVEIGKLLAHPNEHGHFVQFLDVYADDTFLARADFTAVKTCPKVTFSLALEGPAAELRVYEHCNLHGTWVGRHAIKAG